MCLRRMCGVVLAVLRVWARPSAGGSTSAPGEISAGEISTGPGAPAFPGCAMTKGSRGGAEAPRGSRPVRVKAVSS